MKASMKASTGTKEWLSTTLRYISDGVIGTDTRGTVTFMNPAAERLTGRTLDDSVGRPFEEVCRLVLRDGEQAPEDPVATVRRTGSDLPLPLRARLASDSGEPIPIDGCAVPVVADGKGLRGVVLVFHDIAERLRADDEMRESVERMERKEAQDALRRSEERLRLITDNMLDVITQTDPLGVISYQSPSVRSVLGYDPQALLGTYFYAMCHPDDRGKVETVFRRSIRSATPSTVEYRYRHANGAYSWLETVGNPLLDPVGTVTGVVLSSRDITARKRMEDRLRYLSLNDHLTGLYNRTYFEQEMQRLDGGRSHPVGTIVCDVDGLKFVNDTLGHDRGDALLVAVAGVLRRSFRSGDVISRIGGDEFAILLPNTSGQDVDGAVRRVKAAVESHNGSHSDSHLSLSIGYAVSAGRKTSMVDLLRLADDDMYREKLRDGRNARSAMLNMIFRAFKARDCRIEERAERMQGLVTSLAKSLSLPEESVSDLRLLARFHDIGKVGVPEEILSKQDRLTEEEFGEMQRHCEIGYRIAQAAPELEAIADWILRHHEWWNGQGYPGGISGEEIPLESRILSIVDAFDAMTSDRPYRKALSSRAAVRELDRCSGTQFDSNLVLRFFDILEEEAP